MTKETGVSFSKRCKDNENKFFVQLLFLQIWARIMRLIIIYKEKKSVKNQ